MPRMQVYLPTELYDQVKTRKMPASELLQAAIRDELEHARLLAATDKYLAELSAEIGNPSCEEMVRAEALADQILSESDIEPRLAR